jgi:hypothetical protein
MPDLVFQNEQINAPKESLSTAALVHLDTCGLYDVARHKHADSDRSAFLSAFGKALSDHPELISSWKSGDREAYHAAWIKVLNALSSTAPTQAA